MSSMKSESFNGWVLNGRLPIEGKDDVDRRLTVVLRYVS